MRVITVSRTFPGYHPKAGEPTYFVEKTLNAIDNHDRWFAQCDNCGWAGSSLVMNGGGQIADTGDYGDPTCPKCNSIHFTDIEGIEDYYIGKYDPKLHTIRAGNRWKVGDMASLRYWSERPYHSKQIEFAQVEVKKVFTYEVKDFEQGDKFFINGKLVSECNAYMQQWNNVELIKRLAKNDGLDMWDFLNWFKHPKDFIGQIICWSDKVNY